ncbi:MAG: pirin family protein [Leeuwenhoekiella sp.]
MSAIIKIQQLQMPWETSDPFLFCAFHNDNYPKGTDKLTPDATLAGRNLGQDFMQRDGWAMYHGTKVPGFPAHPHMGFETVTVVPQGIVDHADSLGAAGRFGNGDVQWMTAGKGVQHSEMFPMLNQTERNPLLLFQIWLNLPAKNKGVEPYFGMFWHEDIPVIKTGENGEKSTRITLISGKFGDKHALPPAPDSWAADPENDLNIWLIDMEPDATFTLPAGNKDSNRSLYFYEGGQIEAEGFKIPVMQRIITKADEDMVIKNYHTKARFLLLQGKPINEPVVKHGPFVANTSAEIDEAFKRYRHDQFGGWPWPAHDHVHEESKSRFAKYPNGKMEIPG